MLQEIRDTLRSLSLTQRQLRVFGVIGLGIIVFVLWRFPNLWFVLSSLGIWFILGIAAPRLLSPLYYFLMACTLPVGWLISRALLTIFFFCILAPLAIARRILKKDTLYLRFREKEADTYWEDVEENTHYDKMYS